MIENLNACLTWMKDRRHWTESQLEMDKLDRQIDLVETLLFLDCFGATLLKQKEKEAADEAR